MKEQTRIERQLTMTLNDAIAELPTVCDVGSKKNSKGHVETWIGYKLHVDTADNGVPLACLVTSASVHDSQVAIPLMSMTSERFTYLYDVMDSAYDAALIKKKSTELGHIPLVDRNFRSQVELKVETEREAARRRLIGFVAPEDVRYNERTVSERTNSRLKGEFGADNVYVRGGCKVFCHLMFGVLSLAADQLIRLIS